MTLRRFGTLAAILGALHFTLALGSMAVAFSLSMERFDAGQASDEGALEAAASALANALWQPGISIYAAIFVGRPGPWLLQWCIVALNSLLWGAALAWLVLGLRARLKRDRPL
jgi:hypothetical protein